jgi:hypothetical protein
MMMIEPEPNDIGRRVIYRPTPTRRRTGMLTSYDPRRVFVRFDGETESECVFARFLTWESEPPKDLYKDE